MQLYAEFQPDALLQFLISGQEYSLKPALSACQQRGLVAEQVTLRLDSFKRLRVMPGDAHLLSVL